MIFQAVGVYGSGYCGFITAIDQFDGTVKGAFAGVLALAVAASFAICAAASFILLTKVCNRCFYSLLLLSRNVDMDIVSVDKVLRHSFFLFLLLLF